MSEEVIQEMHRVLEQQKKLNISEGAPDINLRKDRLDRVIAMVNKYQDQIVKSVNDDFGNRDPDPRYASWTMWGPVNPERNSSDDLKKVKEYSITKFYWWFDDGFNLLDLCAETSFTYEIDYNYICLDKNSNR